MVSFRTQASLLLADNHLSLQDAQALSQGRLGEAQKKELLSLLRPEHVPDDAVLEHLGLSRRDVQQAFEARDGLVEKAKVAVFDAARKEIFKAHELDVADLDLGDHAGFRLGVKAQLLKSDDPLIKDDPHRRDRAGGDTIWVSSGAGIYPRAGFSGAVPVGPATVSFGFSGDASLGISVLAPYRAEPEAAIALAKKNTTALPFTAGRARDMERGTQVVIRGHGRVVARAGARAGFSLGRLGEYLDVGAGLGGGVRVSAEKELSVRVKRLDGDRVFVSISEVDTKNRGVDFGAHAGVDAHVALGLGGLGGGLIGTAANAVADQVDKQIEKWLKADIRAVHQHGTTEKEVQSYVLDLGRAPVRAAYEDLLRLDTRAADAIAEQGNGEMINGRPLSGVGYVKLDETVRSEDNRLSGHFGPITLLSSVSSAKERHGFFRGTGEGTIEYHRARLDDHYFGIFSHLWKGDRNVTRELVAVKKNDGPEETHYHLTYRVDDDRITSRNDVRRFFTLADHLGALDEKHRDLLGNKAFLKSFGKSDRDIDVYFTPEGLDRIANATEDDIERAFAHAFKTLDRPRAGKHGFENYDAPWLAKDHRKYREAMNLLREGPDPFNNGNDGDDRDRDYWWATGRDLRKDHDAYEELTKLKSIVEAMKAAPDGQARAEIFAKQEGVLGLDFFRSLATLGTLAGEDATLVNEMTIKDEARDLTFVLQREGAIQDIDVEIRRAMAKDV